MLEPRMISRLPIAWAQATVLALVGSACGALFVVICLVGRAGSGVGVLLGTLGLLVWAGLIVLHGGTRIVLTPGRIRVDGRGFDWDALIGIKIEERVREDGSALAPTSYTLLVGDARPFVFDSTWRGSYRVAASLQLGRFDPDARIDREEVSVRAADGRVLAAPRHPHPALTLYVTRAHLDRWLDLVTAILVANGVATAVDRRRCTATSENPFLDMHALAAASLKASEAEWPTRIGWYVERAKRLHAELRWFQGSADGFSRARPVLRVQLYTRDRVPDDALVREDYGPDLCFVVVARLESGETAIDAALLAGWGRSHAELLAIAHDNLAAEPPPERSPAHPHDEDESTGVLFYSADFGAARVARLDALIALDEHLGAFVAVPTRSSLVVRPLREPADAEVVLDGTLTALAELIQSEERGPITTEVYWWRRDAAPVKVVRIVPPEGDDRYDVGPMGDGYVLPDELVRRLAAAGTGQAPA